MKKLLQRAACTAALTLGLTTALPLEAGLDPSIANFFCGGYHEFALGGEVYRLKRTRGTASEIQGTLWGPAASYDYIKRAGPYWGLDADYATGKPDGSTNDDLNLFSTAYRWHVEGRIGYTFSIGLWGDPQFTLFTGYGYLQNSIRFTDGSPAIFRSTIDTSYVPLGFLFRIYGTPLFYVGLRAQALLPINPKNRISEDPNRPSFTQQVGSRTQYLVEIPIEYRCQFGVRITPFYWREPYGGRESFPSNFPATSFDNYGVKIQLVTAL